MLKDSPLNTLIGNSVYILFNNYSLQIINHFFVNEIWSFWVKKTTTMQSFWAEDCELLDLEDVIRVIHIPRGQLRGSTNVFKVFHAILIAIQKRFKISLWKCASMERWSWFTKICTRNLWMTTIGVLWVNLNRSGSSPHFHHLSWALKKMIQAHVQGVP